jgi:predicted nucleic acid-binding protein
VILADTSVWIEYLRRGENGWAHELDELLARGELAMCGPVLGELVAGVPLERRNDYALRLRALPWADLDRDGWTRAGLVRGDLLRDGFTASSIDVTIAVSAAHARATLWSADAVHERVVAAMGDLTLRYERGLG